MHYCISYQSIRKGWEQNSNIRIIRWIIQSEIKFTQRNHNTFLWTNFLMWLYETILTVTRICIVTIIRHEKPADDLIQSGFWVIPKITFGNLWWIKKHLSYHNFWNSVFWKIYKTIMDTRFINCYWIYLRLVKVSWLKI